MKRNFSILHQLLSAGVLSSIVFGGAVAYAATPQSYTINLSAEVPTDNFQVIPVDAGWINQTHDMGYDIATGRLKVFEKQFQYKNTGGAIQAKLAGNLNTSGKPQLSNGTDTIPLKVTFNNVALSNAATTVMSSAAAQAGGRAVLSISQEAAGALTVSGSFTGSVSMIFEPVLAGPTS